jgi:hypothetical protein
VYENLVTNFGADYKFLPDEPHADIRSIAEDSIVCYKLDKTPVRYSDDIWDFKRICSRSETTFNFTRFPRLKDELKRIIYARIFYSPKSRAITSVSMTPVNILAQWANNNHCSIEAMLNDSRLFPFIASSFSTLSDRSASVLLSVIRELRRIRVIHPHFYIGPEDDTLANILVATPRKASDTTQKVSSEQTAVIPSRIYSNFIIGFENYISDFLKNAYKIERIYKSFKTGFKKNPNFISQLKKQGRWEKFLDSHGLLEYSLKHGLEHKKGFNAHLTDIQVISRYWIHLFTGMRKTEVDTLSYGCIADISTHGVTTKIIRGYTSKLTSQGQTPTFWVTTEIMSIGIEAAQTIGRIISIDQGYTVDEDNFPLFPAWQTKNKSHKGRFKNAPYAPSYSIKMLTKRVLAKLPGVKVQQDDIRELELFDGFRNWREEFHLGKPWPLATHQCRRSLAVYLARSGLVSIGSMQVQFKHLCAAMTSYYRRGSSFAVNFLDVDDEEHRDQMVFVDSLEKEQRLAQFLNFEERVITKQDDLWGGEGKRIRKAFERNEPLVIISDRQRTKQRFERGEMAFKESPLGGCTKVGSCDRLSITHITECIECEHSILDEKSIPKIQKQIANLKIERNQYKPGSLFYEHTQREIDELNKKLVKILGETS